jgi:hypothetical protein
MVYKERSYVLYDYCRVHLLNDLHNGYIVIYKGIHFIIHCNILSNTEHSITISYNNI